MGHETEYTHASDSPASGCFDKIQQVPKIATHCDDVDLDEDPSHGGILQCNDSSVESFVSGDRIVYFRAMRVNAENEFAKPVVGQLPRCHCAKGIQCKICNAAGIERAANPQCARLLDNIGQVRDE